MLYALFFFYYKKRQDNAEYNKSLDDAGKPDDADGPDENTPKSP